MTTAEESGGGPEPEWLEEAGMWAKPSCNDCYGRGYKTYILKLDTGVQARKKLPCYCVKKERDRSNLEEVRAAAPKAGT